MLHVCQIFHTITLDTLDILRYTLDILTTNIEQQFREVIIMRSTSGERTRAVSSAISQDSMCSRCGGLLVSDFCIDSLDSTGELEVAAKRCVQCGEVIDPVIQRNRGLRQEPMTGRPAARMLSNNSVTDGRQ